jgi:hypothetical protein
MTPGFISVPDLGAPVKWADGEATGFLKIALGIGLKTTELRAKRCSQCGYVEFFADTRSQPVSTLKSVEDDNERLKDVVSRLQERLAVLERIATDPAARTAREIDVLRDDPDRP